MVRLIFILLSVAGCSTPAMDPDLSLHDRFVLTTLTEDDRTPRNFLYRWERPIYVEYQGPLEFRQDVEDQLELLGRITGLPIKMDASRPTVIVEISERDTPSTCQVEYSRGSPGARVHIFSRLTDLHVRSCIIQEMAHVMGPSGDLDGLFGSRSDTVFASWGGSDHLTDQDRQILQILFDDRLYHGMPRADVLAILPEIVADIEAEQEPER